MNDKRGPYRRYLQENELSVPPSTIRYRNVAQRKRNATQAQLDQNTDESSDSSEQKNLKIETYISSSDTSVSLYDDESEPDADFNNKIDDIQQTKKQSECFDINEENSPVCETVFPSSSSEGSIVPANIQHFSQVDEYPHETNLHNNYEDSDVCSTIDESDNDHESFYNEERSSSSNSDDSDNEINEGCSSLYESSEITKAESDLLIMAYALRHNVTDIGLENMISLIDCHLPYIVHGSKYKFLKNFPYPQVKEYYYCTKCCILLPDFDAGNSSCNICQERYEKQILKKNGEYFLYLPLKEQLINFVKSKEYSFFRKIDHTDSDILNGKVYKQLVNNGTVRANDITLTWNTDGVSLFTSSKKSMWPLQVSINELPYRIRKNNIILCGLWYNQKKPPMNLFLKPFVQEMVTLCRDGFDSTTFLSNNSINIKVHTILSSVDSVARPAIQNMKQFNGEYGCSYCFHKGKSIVVGRGHARMYSYSKKLTRTTQLHNRILQRVMETGKSIKGVKGPSVTVLIPRIDIIESYPPEYMHACLLGVGKLFGNAWFDSTNSNENWYIGLSSQTFNNRLLSIKPPTEITRVPQSIVDNKYKASEWKNFILYYSLPCLNRLLPKKYLQHWMLFVLSLSIFLQPSINSEQFDVAKTALCKFVQDIEKLYGKTFMKYNVHVLTHIPHFIKLYGALWAWSAFPFEHYNGVIKRLYHGTQYVPKQIVKLYTRLRYIKNNADIFNDVQCNKKIHGLFVELMNQCKVKNCIVYNDLRIFGKAKAKKLTITEKVVIETAIAETVETDVDTYHRFIYKNILFHSCNYKRMTKRSNCYVMCSDETLLKITQLIKVKCSNSVIKYVVLGNSLTILNQQLCQNGSYSSNVFSFVTQETERLICYDVSALKKKCLAVPYENCNTIVYPLVNMLETD